MQKKYLDQNGTVLLLDYLNEELTNSERIVAQNDTWVALVPYWAVWPFELMLIPREHTNKISDLNTPQQNGLSQIMKAILVKYDNIFQTSFPYSMGWHGAPFLNENTDHWQLHAHYYPPLLRSATIKKFMVGYEMLGSAQRDITPEVAAQMIRQQSLIHYKKQDEQTIVNKVVK
jgi:UDPglucose--hexose-1-phosphate uridylyltransferase